MWISLSEGINVHLKMSKDIIDFKFHSSIICVQKSEVNVGKRMFPNNNLFLTLPYGTSPNQRL